jgi:competence protein ComEA
MPRITTVVTQRQVSRLSTPPSKSSLLLFLSLACCAVNSLGWSHSVAAAQAAESAPASPGVVNLNSASAEELERLPGIGPSRARAILALRAKLSHFSRLEDLLRVKGIGRATFRKLRPWLALSGPTTLQSNVATGSVTRSAAAAAAAR